MCGGSACAYVEHNQHVQKGTPLITGIKCTFPLYRCPKDCTKAGDGVSALMTTVPFCAFRQYIEGSSGCCTHHESE